MYVVDKKFIFAIQTGCYWKISSEQKGSLSFSTLVYSQLDSSVPFAPGNVPEIQTGIFGRKAPLSDNIRAWCLQ